MLLKNKDGDRVIVMLNLSAKPQTAMITKDIPAMQDIFTLQAASYKRSKNHSKTLGISGVFDPISMKFEIWAIGKCAHSYLQNGIELYCKNSNITFL